MECKEYEKKRFHKFTRIKVQRVWRQPSHVTTESMKKRTIVLFQSVTGRENKKAKQQAAGCSRAAADTFQFTKSNYM